MKSLGTFIGVRFEQFFTVGLTLLIVLNGFDLFSTVFMVGVGLAVEVNPLAKYFLDHGPGHLAFFKIFFVGWGAWALYFLRHRFRRAVTATLIILLVEYISLAIYQIHMMLNVVPLIRSCF